MKQITRRTAAVLAILLGILGAGVAFAAWTQTGTGSGAAGATTAQASTIVAGSASADLYPGKAGGSVRFSVDNPNDYPVTFTSLAASSISSDDGANCPSSHVSVTSPVSVSIAVPANSTSAVQTVAGVTNMASTAPDGCQGVTFTVNLTLSGSSS